MPPHARPLPGRTQADGYFIGNEPSWPYHPLIESILKDPQGQRHAGLRTSFPEGEGRHPGLPRFANVVMTQDWHTVGHVSFASAHPGKKPFETVDLAYGTQVLWPDHCVQGTEGAALVEGACDPAGRV